MIVATIGAKGGIGKTAVTAHEADWLNLHGWKVVYVEVDKQKLGCRFLDTVGVDFDTKHITEAKQIYDELPKLAAKYDIVLVDAPAGLDDTSLAVLYRADIVIVPTPPGYWEIQSTEWTARTIKSVQEERGGLPQAAIVATRYEENQVVSSNLKNVAKRLHFGFLDSGIPEKTIIKRACGRPNDSGEGWLEPPNLLWRMGRREAVRDAARCFDFLFREMFPEACEKDPLLIARMMIPKTRWDKLSKDWIGEENDRAIAANS